MSNCSIFEIADLLGKKWTLVVLQEIDLNGKNGFNAILKRMKKISPKILSRRLNQLEEKGLLERKFTRNSLNASYSLTEKGKDLQKIISVLKNWNIQYSGIVLDCAKNECVNCKLY